MRGLPIQITRAPMRTVRPVLLRELYANPEKELIRLRERGLVTKIAHGTYVAKPDIIDPSEQWKPPFEEAAMAYATAAYGERIPVLMGIGAARHWHAIPRAVGVTVIGVPLQHRPVTLETGGKIIFTVRDPKKMATIPVEVGLGMMLVTRIEQTLVDLILQPGLGGMPCEAFAASKALLDTVDVTKLNQILQQLPRAANRRVRTWLDKEAK